MRQGWWRQGQTLPTNITRKWSKEEWERNDATEKRMVFANFREEDSGKSRIRICVCDNEHDAELICKAVNERQKLLDTLKECADFLKDVKRMYDDVNPVGGWQYIDDGSQMYLKQINELLKP